MEKHFKATHSGTIGRESMNRTPVTPQADTQGIPGSSTQQEALGIH
jgi:hypothetical protein